MTVTDEVPWKVFRFERPANEEVAAESITLLLYCVSAAGHPVLELKRVALGDLEFSDLKEGDIRRLTEEEEFMLREQTGLQ